MSHLWEKRLGDDRFAFGIAFRDDPDDGQGVARDESLSWGSFQLWADGVNLCDHLEEGERIESVHWYLLPLLEWLADRWDDLLHEERLPGRNAGVDAWGALRETRTPPLRYDEEQQERWHEQWQAWWGRHALQSCRTGGLFPDVYFRRSRDAIEVSWGRSPIAGAPDHVRFLTPRGTARLEPVRVAEPLYAVLRDATAYLLDKEPDSPRLKALCQRVAAIPQAARKRRLALLAGLGTSYADRFDRWDQVVSYFPAMPSEVASALFGGGDNALVLTGTCQAALMFGSVAPTVSEADAIALAHWLVALYSPDGDGPDLAALIRHVPVEDDPGPAWRGGVALAEEVLELLELPRAGQDSVDVDAIYGRLGIGRDVVSLSDHSIRAVSIAGPYHRPFVLLNQGHRTYRAHPGQRFTLAHELCHLLFDRAYGQPLAIASGPWAPRDVERRANAFAAMLLMPKPLVEKAVGSLTVPLDSLDAVRTVADSLQTSPKAALEHLTNQGFIDEATRDEIRGEL